MKRRSKLGSQAGAVAENVVDRGSSRDQIRFTPDPYAARRLLIEAGWCYRFPARVSRDLRLRQEDQPKPIRDIAWKGQVRLCARYRKLARARKPANVVTAAIARELAGFVWAIARQVTIPAG